MPQKAKNQRNGKTSGIKDAAEDLSVDLLTAFLKSIFVEVFKTKQLWTVIYDFEHFLRNIGSKPAPAPGGRKIISKLFIIFTTVCTSMFHFPLFQDFFQCMV